MRITVKNYLENRSMLLECDNPKIIELAQGTDADLVEVYGQDATIDDGIDTAIERFNQYLESKSEALEDAYVRNMMSNEEGYDDIEDEMGIKPKPKKRTSVSKSRAKGVSALKAKRRDSVVAKMKAKAGKNISVIPAVTPKKVVSKELSATLDKGDVVKDKEIKKEIVVNTVNGSNYTGHEVKAVVKKEESLFESWTKKVKAVPIQKPVLTKAQQKVFDANQHENHHSENILFLAKLTKNQVLIDAMKFCIKENDKYGSLHPESKELTYELIADNKIRPVYFKEVANPETDNKAKEAAKEKIAKEKEVAKAKTAKEREAAKAKTAKAKEEEKAKKAKEKEAAKVEKPVFGFTEGQLVSKGKMLFLVVSSKKDSVSLEEIDGKMLSNESIKGFKATPIIKLDERMVKERKEIAILEGKVKNESEVLRKLHLTASNAYQSARALGKKPNAATVGKGASEKFDKLKSLIYQKSVLQVVHRKDIAALKVIFKKSNIDVKQYDKELKEITSLGMAKNRCVSKSKGFHLLKPKTWF